MASTKQVVSFTAADLRAQMLQAARAMLNSSMVPDAADVETLACDSGHGIVTVHIPEKILLHMLEATARAFLGNNLPAGTTAVRRIMPSGKDSRSQEAAAVVEFLRVA